MRSIVGRYLEHSRIFRFGPDDYYIGSADLMPRNLDRRVEVLVPVVDPSLRQRLAQILTVDLEDDTLSWRLLADGSWIRLSEHGTVNAQERLQDLALDRMHESRTAHG